MGFHVPALASTLAGVSGNKPSEEMTSLQLKGTASRTASNDAAMKNFFISIIDYLF
jgi:hypothetical protein